MVYGLLAGATAGALAAPTTASAVPTQPRQSVPVKRGEMSINVRDYGAVGDGATDDTAAVQAAVAAADGSGHAVFFPAGAYKFTSPLRTESSLSLFGEGMWASVVILTDDAAFIDPGTNAPTLDISDLGFDRQGRRTFVCEVDGIHALSINRCRFFNLAGPWSAPAAIHLHAFGDVELTDCLWHNPARYAGQGTAVRADAHADGQRLMLRGNNRIRALSQGVRCDTGWLPKAQRKDGRPPYTIDLVDIDGLFVDGYWWLLPAVASGAGSGVSYTDLGLTDANADFSDLLAAKTRMNVRAMPVRRSGSVTSATTTSLTDSSADFGADGVLRGEIVRSGGAFAVVMGAGAADPTVLQLEEWLDNETWMPTGEPPAGADYTLYEVLIGQCEAESSTVIAPAEPGTKGGWKDLTGAYVTPPEGTRYEVLTQNPNYSLQTSVGVMNLRVANSTFRRGWSDQIGYYGRRAQIIGNRFEDGNDVGVTIETTVGEYSTGHVVVGNTFNHQGSVGIFLKAHNSIVADNRISNSGWNIQLDRSADISLFGGNDNLVANNVGESGSESVHHIDGITMRGGGTGNVLDGNRKISTDRSEVQLNGAGLHGNHIMGARSIRHVGAAEGQLLDMIGEGDPEGRVAASAGSIYRRTDGGAGEALYLKESGTGVTGWVAK